MKSLTLLWQKVLIESGTWCRTSTVHDWKTAVRRFESEGISFFTISLTNFGKDFEKALDQGFVDSNQFAGFKRSGGLPKFLSGFLRLVFESDGCGLLPDPSIDAISSVRQLTLMFGKILIPCSETRNQKAVDGYVQCEMDLRELDRRGSFDRAGSNQPELGRLVRVFAMLFGPLLDDLERDLQDGRYENFVPKHGPGATADRLRGNQKFSSDVWSQRLDRVFPVVEFLLSSARHVDRLHKPGRYPIHEPGQECPVKVTLVPKTLKTPRIIAMEPTYVQYAQQALLGGFLRRWEKDDLLLSLSDFREQGPNQELARMGSETQALATLDLSEASDRVSNSLVLHLFHWWPALSEAVQAVRSQKADVPYGVGVIRLAKYASMGSAMTFLIETMVFLTIICASIEKSRGYTLSRKDYKRLAGSVRVYGDDLIVPVDYVLTVISDLEAFGFKVNTDKSFWTGKFRESCGKDYYDGHDVSVTRVRRVFPSGRSNAEEVISMVSLRNQLYSAGYWSTCQWIDEEIRKVLPYFPIVRDTSPVIGRHSFIYPTGQRMCDQLHRPLVKGFVVKAIPPVNPVDDLPALLKFFTTRGATPLESGHLERSGRPRTVDIKARWASPV